jgi:hypothetical protein
MCQDQALATCAGKRIEDVTVGGSNTISEPRWQQVLNAYDLRASEPRLPLLQYHDPPTRSSRGPWRQHWSQWRAMGVTPSLASHPGDRVTTQVKARAPVAGWLADTPAPDNWSLSRATIAAGPPKTTGTGELKGDRDRIGAQACRLRLRPRRPRVVASRRVRRGYRR